MNILYKVNNLVIEKYWSENRGIKVIKRAIEVVSWINWTTLRKFRVRQKKDWKWDVLHRIVGDNMDVIHELRKVRGFKLESGIRP